MGVSAFIITRHLACALVFALLSCIISFVCSTERNATCITPNGENGICITYDSCKIIKDAIKYRNATALQFAKMSECGFDDEPLVCCGSVAFFEAKIQTNVPADKKVCGYQILGDRIIGGEVTDIGEFPWMALLGYRNSHGGGVLEFKCGGTLINNRYILTAAHCIKFNPAFGKTLEMARLGEWKISTKEDCIDYGTQEVCADPVVDVLIERQIFHPRYSKKSGNNDIGLLRLERNVKYTEHIRPICLPESESEKSNEMEVGTFLMVSGWGTTENGTTADVKMKLSVPVVSSAECATKVRINGEVTENQICAGGEYRKDSCRGDSGGPLMLVKLNLHENPQWRQEGIISWGVGCGRTGIPAVYTRVVRYINWIIENLA